MIPGIKEECIRLHFFSGSCTFRDLFLDTTIIKNYEVVDIKEDIRYTKSRASDWGLAKNQHCKGFRVKGIIKTGFGVDSTFDVLITCKPDVNLTLNEKLSIIKSTMKAVENFLKNKVKN